MVGKRKEYLEGISLINFRIPRDILAIFRSGANLMMVLRQEELLTLVESLGLLLVLELTVESKKWVFWKLKVLPTAKTDLLPHQTELLAPVTISQRDQSLVQNL